MYNGRHTRDNNNQTSNKKLSELLKIALDKSDNYSIIKT